VSRAAPTRYIVVVEPANRRRCPSADQAPRDRDPPPGLRRWDLRYPPRAEATRWFRRRPARSSARSCPPRRAAATPPTATLDPHPVRPPMTLPAHPDQGVRSVPSRPPGRDGCVPRADLAGGAPGRAVLLGAVSPSPAPAPPQRGPGRAVMVGRPLPARLRRSALPRQRAPLPGSPGLRRRSRPRLADPSTPQLRRVAGAVDLRAALPAVLALCPPGAKIPAWHRGERPTASWHPLHAWEPVIYYGGRPVDPAARSTRRIESLVCGTCAKTRLPGRVMAPNPGVPPIGLRPARRGPHRHLDDLLPGSGAVPRAWAVCTNRSDLDPSLGPELTACRR
jgi:hypothetical protein